MKENCPFISRCEKERCQGGFMREMKMRRGNLKGKFADYGRKQIG